ncbi:aminopeptidase N [uncultured Algimonas sp.]|uniref:aminopeptidase N n=1 Tax=uncultured Algimonas sp. TaxID=1547920 RepID=UPI002617B65D|nr:aminopeptidase N [uncultured Algimonas sp.]
MKTDAAPAPTRLSDYVPYNFDLASAHLDFGLDPKRTRVRSTLQLTRTAPGPLVLDGEAIDLVSVQIDGRSLKRTEYRLTQDKLILEDVPDAFSLTVETVCDPSANTTLMGLYVSGGRFCTQCEAEGFRRITYYPDRPDVMSVFTVRIEADKTAYPTLLANGNLIESGETENGRHYAVWHDPFPKPCYLFALVAGEFDRLDYSFTTMSGRDIPLEIYVDPGDAPKAAYAMDSLKRAMAWDERAFGREYDLDRFMIVAVRDFNFGAMENKGLNIFNSALLLADGETATDLNFERIESVVAHEYFHNWTGNRITCRDWFQLCLKEGFTVFRDQEFSADQRGAAVQRIKDVRALRARQFAEDNGPLAHPVRPTEYLKIDNFYTATIYEKGAELIRMLKAWLGDEMFRKGCDVYFDRLDGTAATVEQFLACFEEASGEEMSQFMQWYRQAGTPRLTVRRHQTPTTPVISQVVSFHQDTPPTPGQAHKEPLLIPVRWQAIGDDGPLMESQLTVMTTADEDVSYPRFDVPHSLSVLQGFSAPVILKSDASTADLVRLMGNDPDAFNRWEAGQTLARRLLTDFAKALESGAMPDSDTALRDYVRALGKTLANPDFDNAFKALVLTPPGAMEVLMAAAPVDPIAVYEAGNWLSRAVADGLRDDLVATYKAMRADGAFSPDAHAAGRRALRGRCLALLAARFDPLAAPLATQQLDEATNMTDEMNALVILSRLGGQRVEQNMEAFFARWKDKPLVLDKWYSVQAMRHHADGIHAITRLAETPTYERSNPNRVRALVGGFSMGNAKLFHKIDGSGYRFFADQVLDMDDRNPSVAARLLGAFEIWRKLDAKRQALIRAELERIVAAEPSKNVLEIAQRTLG